MDVPPLSSRIVPIRGEETGRKTCVLSIDRSIERTESRRGPCKLVFRRGSRVVSEGCDVGRRPSGAVPTNHSFSGVPQWWRVVSVRFFVGHKTLLSHSLFLSFCLRLALTDVPISLAPSLCFTAPSHLSLFCSSSYHLVVARHDVIFHYEYGIIFFRGLIFAKAHVARMLKSFFLCFLSFSLLSHYFPCIYIYILQLLLNNN